MPVTLMRLPARGNGGGSLLRLVLFALAAFLFLVTASQEVEAQTNMTLGQLIPDLIRNTSQTVSATSAGLQVAEAGSVGIRSGSSLIGSVAINELRSIPLATVASRAVTSTLPGVLAALAIDLAIKGITQCASSATGWCKPGATNPASGDSGFNGYQWVCHQTAVGSSPLDACNVYAQASGSTNYYAVGLKGSCGAGCSFVQMGNKNNPADMSQVWSAVQLGGCVSGYVSSGGTCVPDPNANVPPVPIQYPELATDLANVLSGNPNRAKDYWGFEPWTEQASWLADPSTQALPAQVVSPADGKVSGPSTSTQTSTGTTTQQTSCTVSPNSDANTLANKPVSVACTTTTTNPDGTTSTSTTTTTPTTGDGTNPQPPASSPIPCGLGTNGSPKCQIDETGTPASNTQVQTDTKAKLDNADASLRTGLGSVTGSGKPDTTIDGILPRFSGQCRTASFQVALPTGVITQEVDPCPNWNYIQFVMSFVWCVATVLGCIAMVKQTIDGG